MKGVQDVQGIVPFQAQVTGNPSRGQRSPEPIQVRDPNRKDVGDGEVNG